MIADLYYIDQGLFTAFIPNTKAGETAWNDIAKETEGTGKVLTCHVYATIHQLKQAGYTVRKAPKQKPIDPAELEKMLDELEM